MTKEVVNGVINDSEQVVLVKSVYCESALVKMEQLNILSKEAIQVLRMASSYKHLCIERDIEMSGSTPNEVAQFWIRSLKSEGYWDREWHKLEWEELFVSLFQNEQCD